MSTDPSTYKFNHTMLRVVRPQESVKFFETLGMKLINKYEQPEAKFDLYFMAYDGAHAVSHGKPQAQREGIIELTHNYGSEDQEGPVYHNGNAKEFQGKTVKQGFGHTCISVDNLQAACQKFEDAGYKFQKKLSDGRMRSIAFILSPNDDYWVEIIGQNPVEKTEGIKETNPDTYRMNHTMLRVKDAQKSLKFYQDVMGMTLMRTSENKDAGFNLYFLGYGPPAGESSANGVNPTAEREGLLELTWNYGSEKEEGPVYSSGNQEPKGFGHICVSVDNLEAACKRFDEHGVKWQKKLTDGRMKSIAFVRDEDDYWIEVIGQS